MANVEQVIIVGSGPAGYTAALYTARANLNPLVIEGFLWGGLLQQTTDVENYPGYPEGIMGPEMMQQFRDQAERFGTRFITDHATQIEPGADGEPHTVWVGDDEYNARTVILAMGAEHKKLGVPGEEELGGRGVSYCATCDAAFFKDKTTVDRRRRRLRDGGGDLPREVRLQGHGRPPPRRVPRLEDHARPRARDREHRVPDALRGRGVRGRRGRRLGKAMLRNTETGEERDLPISGAFIAVGHEPQSELVEGIVDTDDNGYVVTEGKSTRTDVPGIFAAGDLVDHTYRQAVTAAGSGCQAALDAEWYLRDNPAVPTPASLKDTGDLAEAQWAAPSASPSQRGGRRAPVPARVTAGETAAGPRRAAGPGALDDQRSGEPPARASIVGP